MTGFAEGDDDPYVAEGLALNDRIAYLCGARRIEPTSLARKTASADHSVRGRIILDLESRR